jgi:hypothetical protein
MGQPSESERAGGAIDGQADQPVGGGGHLGALMKALEDATEPALFGGGPGTVPGPSNRTQVGSVKDSGWESETEPIV